MALSTFLEIDFLKKDRQGNLKDPITIELTMLENGNYTLSKVLDYNLLHYSLTSWLQIHNTSTDSTQEQYSDLLFSKKKVYDREKDDELFWTDVPEEDFRPLRLGSIDEIESETDLNTRRVSLSVEVKSPDLTIIEKTPENEQKMGKITYKTGRIYEGQVLDGKANGFGYMVDGEEKLLGYWKNDKMHGFSFQKFKNGSVCIGTCVDGQRDGSTEFYFSSGDRYVGETKNKHLHGKGTYYFGKGDKYVGGWKDSKKSGYGENFYYNGSIYKGIWKDGLKNGIFQIVDHQGKSTKATYTNGHLIKD